MTETILNSFGLSAANYNMLMELLDYYRVRVIKNAIVEKYENGEVHVVETIKNYPNTANRAKLMFAVGPNGISDKKKITADHVVISVGYASDAALYDAVKGDHVHLIGDAKHPANVMESIWGAYEIAMNL
jgi:2-enoate reductase